MKKTIRQIVPAILLLTYSIIAGGSLEDTGITLAIVLGIVVIGVIFLLITSSIDAKKKSEQGLERAKDIIGNYTHQVEYQLGKFILYDETTNRILLKDSVSDSRKLKELKISKRDPRTRVTYTEESVTKTSTGSAIGRGVVGAVLLGPVGAVVGGATAKKTTKTKKIPQYHQISGYYSIDVLDFNGNSRAMYGTRDIKKHKEVRDFLQNIIDKNHEPERIAREIKAAKNHNAIQLIDASSIVVGSRVELGQGLLINSTKTAEDNGDNYILCPDVVTMINKGLGTNFDEVRVKIRNGLLSELVGVSQGYTAGKFQDLVSDAHILSQQISSQYGEPSNLYGEISYTELTDDKNRTMAYNWGKNSSQILKIDFIYDKGKFKFEFTSEIK